MKTYTLKSLFIASLLSLVACKNDNPDQLTEGKTKRNCFFAPKVSGRILKIYVEEGQTVKAGDTLAMLDVPEVSAKIAQAKGLLLLQLLRLKWQKMAQQQINFVS
jgi:HlyD family secretion protein